MKQRLIDTLLEEYGQSHQNSTNKTIHWICVPLIMFSLLGLLMSIPFPGGKTLLLNWASIFIYLAWIYYLRLSIVMFIAFVPVAGLMIWLNFEILKYVEMDALKLVLISTTVFALAWVGQFIGHNIEGKKPSFLKDLQFLLIGPAWLLHFIFNKLGLKY